MKKVTTVIAMIALLLPSMVQARVQSDEKVIPMGEFRITFYCSCYECSGKWGTQTATGNHCEEGRTVAVDPSVIAYGTRIKIGKNVYVAEDCGGAIKGDAIDIYVDDHDRAQALGVKYTDVWLIK